MTLPQKDETLNNIACGIDPGIANTGFAIIERLPTLYRLLRSGSIRTASSAKLGNRLDALYIEIQTLLTEYSPDRVCIESVYFNRNINQLPINSGRYSDLQIAKRAVTGTGTASKRYVNRIVNRLLRVSDIKNHHEADAAAIAITGVLHPHFLD